MSNDLLPSPDLLAEPVKDAGTAAVPPDDAGNERKRGVFTEYKAADAAPDANDTRALLQTIARLEAAMRDAPSRVTAGLLRGLADFAAAIKQIESMLAANEAPAPDVHFAVEHMQDIAMALRLREVEAALCDTLDAAIREVGDAIVRSDAAAARTHSAAALLRELARQINQMIALGDDITGAAKVENIDWPAEAAAERFDSTSRQPLADSIDAPASDEERGSLPQPLPLVTALPDKQAPNGLAEDRANLFEPASSSLLRAPDIVAEEAAAARGRPSALLIAETSVSNLALSAATTDITEANAPAAPISTRPPLDISAEKPETARAAATDPLAALNALSEEEIIALFS
jgi:hypothetical protein